MKKSNRKALAAIVALVLALAMLPAFSFAEAAEDEYVEKTETYSFNGEEGSNLEDTEFADFFVMQIVRGAGGEGTVTEDGSVELQKYAGFYSDIDYAYDYLGGAYTYELDYAFIGTNPTMGGIFVRMTDPKAYAITNPKNAGTQQTFDTFEWDWYKENGGKGDGISSIGGSGIKVSVDNPKSSISISIKTRVEDGLFVHSQGVSIAFPEGFQKDGFNRYRFVDDGKTKVEIYVNDALLATVEYGGERGTYPDGDEGDSDVTYYKHAVIKDASGTELLTLDNARISAEYGGIGVGNRGDVVSRFNNVVIKYMAKKKANPTAAPATPTPAPTEKAEPTANATENSSGATAAPATGSGAKATEKPADKDEGGNYTWLFIVCGVVAAAAVAVILVSVLKGKKKK